MPPARHVLNSEAAHFQFGSLPHVPDVDRRLRLHRTSSDIDLGITPIELATGERRIDVHAAILPFAQAGDGR